MIDSHAHIDAPAFDDDRAEMLQRAWDAGVTCIVMPDIEPSRRAGLKALVESDVRLYRGIGVHPHNVGEIQPDELERVEAQCHEQRVVAIGEIGLDYYYDFCPREVQKSYFREQLRIAKRNALPAIIHNRDSDDDMLAILEDEQDGTLHGVLHCFSSGVEMLDRALALGMHVSFTGNITFKNSTLAEVVSRVPENRFMIETDSPYITPVPHRGKRNEPAYVSLVAQKIAEIRGMTVPELISLTSATARKFFGVLTILLCTVATAYAQPARPNEDDYETDYQFDRVYAVYEADSLAWAKLVKPRTLGFGVVLGSNTQVELQQFTQTFKRGTGGAPHVWKTYASEAGPEKSLSYTGQAAIGATLAYQLTERWMLDGSWTYTKNDGPQREFGLDPIITQLYNLTAYYSLNPYNKVNFLASFGGSFATTAGGDVSTSKFGIAPGMSLGIAIPTPWGILYPMANIRFNVMLGKDLDRVVVKHNALNNGDLSEQGMEIRDGLLVERTAPFRLSTDRADVNTIYSIVGMSLIFYPHF